MGVESGRKSGLARASRRDKSFATDKYKRVLPRHKNKVLEYVVKNKPEFSLIDRQIPEVLSKALSKRSLPIQLYRRILLNETVVTLDELHDLADVLRCSVKDLV